MNAAKTSKVTTSRLFKASHKPYGNCQNVVNEMYNARVPLPHFAVEGGIL
jgi:hypothetical protein